jgi:chlorobactene glucosyltransferase
VALAGDRDLALLSLLSTLTFEHFFEQVAQVAAAVKLLSLYPIERVNRSRRPRPFANGQFLLFRRDWYERIGGHAALKDDLLEDIAAAKLVNGHGGHSAVALADGMLMCSMYESLVEFRQGWKRIFIEACGRKPARLRKWAARTLVIDVALPLVQLVTLASAPAVAFTGQVPLAVVMTMIVLTGWTIQGTVLWRFYTMGRAPRLAIGLYPIGCLIVGRIMLAGARDLKRRRPVVWGGKRYVLTPR